MAPLIDGSDLFLCTWPTTRGADKMWKAIGKGNQIK